MRKKKNMYYNGDILFYTALAGDIYDQAIVNVTGSRFVHAAIALNDVSKIECLNAGVMINAIGNRGAAASWSYINELTSFDAVALHNALNWALMQKGNAYGWEDVGNVLLHKAGIDLTINTGNLLFCSGLCLEFLQLAGGMPEPVRLANPHSTTPGMLANLLGVV